MKLKQKAHTPSRFSSFGTRGGLFIAASLVVGIASLLFVTSPASADTGACSTNAGYQDACMETNRKKTPLGATAFNNAVHACEGRDSLGAAAPLAYHGLNSQSGSCSNAVASCYSKVLDKRVCTNDSALALATETNDGEISAEDWDKAIDAVNQYTSGDDFQTNSGIKGDRQRAYEKQIDDSKVCDARGTAPAAEACKTALKKAFTDCYSSLGGDHAAISQSALDECVTKKRQQLAQNETECKAAGGNWTGGTGAAQPGVTQRCEAKQQTPATTGCEGHGGLAANGKCADGTTPAAGGTKGDAGNCGTAKTNLISCTETDPMQVIGAILKQIIGILSIGIGIAAVGGIAYAAIIYAGATDSASNTQQAITIIRNIVIGIIVYGFMIAIINWLVPGGVIG